MIFITGIVPITFVSHYFCTLHYTRLHVLHVGEYIHSNGKHTKFEET